MTTTARPLDLTQIPHKLKTLPQWVCWKGIPKQNGKITKPLLKPWGTAPMLASHSTPDDWGTFDQACTSLSLWGPQYPEVHGIGFVFSKNDPYGGIDLDDCYDPQTGRLLAWAQYIVGQFNTYTEISPSEHGVKLWGRGTLPGPGKNKQPIEIYDRDRYFTVTGQHLPGTPTTIEDRQELFTAYYAVWDLLSAALKASEQFAISLFPGQWQKKYPSQSEADLAFCTVLANLSASDEQIDALLQLSGLYRDQWNRQSYRAVTLRKARTERISRKKTPQEKREGHAREATADATHRTNGQQANDRSPLPPIAITPDIKTVVDASQTALLALTPRPQVFQRARRLCRMTTGVTPPKWLNRPPDLPIITELNAARLNELLTMATTFQKYDRRSKEWYDVLPPAWIAETLLSRGAWPFPLLEGIVYTPTLRPDGSFLNTPGYDADTGLYLYMNGTTFPPMPEHPTRDDARSAIKALREVFQDFPLHNAHDFSAVLAYVLTMVARYAIPGSVPLGGISANTPGTGKGLLVDAMTMIGTGRYATKWPQTIGVSA